MREIAVVFDPERKLFLYGALVGVLVLSGPFGTYASMSVWDRVMFWSLDILGVAAIMLPFVHTFYHSRFVAGITPLVRLIAGISVGAVPSASFVTLLAQTLDGAALPVPPYPLLLLHMILFTTVLLLVEYELWPRIFGPGRPIRLARVEPDKAAPEPKAAAEPEPGPGTPDPARPPIFDRLPAELRHGEVISISMQDHYAEITTTKGEHLILIRLGDAIDLLDGIPGAQVHRSHWASEQHAKDLRKAGRRHELVMSDGRALPVSAGNLEAARALVEPRG